MCLPPFSIGAPCGSNGKQFKKQKWTKINSASWRVRCFTCFLSPRSWKEHRAFCEHQLVVQYCSPTGETSLEPIGFLTYTETLWGSLSTLSFLSSMNHAMTFVVKRLVLYCSVAKFQLDFAMFTLCTHQNQGRRAKTSGKDWERVWFRSQNLSHAWHAFHELGRFWTLAIDAFKFSDRQSEPLRISSMMTWLTWHISVLFERLWMQWKTAWFDFGHLWFLFGHLAALPIYSLAMSSECCYTRWKEWRWWDVRACSREIF